MRNLTYATISDYSDTLIYQLAYRRRWVIIGVCIAIVLFFAILIVTPQLQAEPYSDNAYYLVVAKSLSEGTGLRLISNPEIPLATVAPPGYPVLLSGLVKIFGLESTLPYRTLSFVFWLGTIILLGFLVKQEDGKVWGFLVAFLVALNVYVMEYAKEILTELPFTFFSIVVILLAYKHIKNNRSQQWIWLVALVFTLSFLLYLRMIAIALVGAVVLYFFLHRKIYTGLVTGALVGLSYLPWVIIWGQRASSPVKWFATNDPFNRDAQPEPFLNVVSERVISNSSYYAPVTSQNVLGWSAFNNLSSPLAYNILTLMVVSAILIGWWIKFKSLQTILIPLYIVFYLLVLIVMVSKGIERYLIPITPFLVWYFLVGVATAIGVVGTRLTNNISRLRLVFFAVCIALIYSVMFSGLLVGLIKLPILLGQAPPESMPVHSYLETADWLRNNVPLNEIILARKMDSVYLRSGHQAVRYPFTTNQEVMFSFLDHYNIQYVILDNLGYPSREDFLLPFLNGNQKAFEEVFRSPDDLTIVYRYNPKMVSK